MEVEKLISFLENQQIKELNEFLPTIQVHILNHPHSQSTNILTYGQGFNSRRGTTIFNK